MYKRFACLKTTEKRSIGTKIKFLLYLKKENFVSFLYYICKLQLLLSLIYQNKINNFIRNKMFLIYS